VIAVFLRRALENASLQINAMSQLGDDGCIRDYVYVSDIARANLDALEGKLSAAVMNLGTGQATTTRSLAESILRTYSDSQSKLSFAPARVGDIQRSVLDGSRYSLQTAPYTDFSTGMRLTAAWYREAMAELKA
jgi:UDP-glucose 4-epimerase